MILTRRLGIALVTLLLSNSLAVANTARSCNPYFPGWQPDLSSNASEPQRIGYQTRAAIAKIAQRVGLPQKLRGPILATSPVNQQNLKQTSDLGHLIASEAANCFAQLGFTVKEDRTGQTSDLIQRQDGRLTLSREGASVAQKQNAAAVLIGTYLRRAKGAYINLKLIHPEDNRILGAASYWLDKKPNSHSSR